jgi:hypothetical protein
MGEPFKVEDLQKTVQGALASREIEHGSLAVKWGGDSDENTVPFVRSRNDYGSSGFQ